MNQLIENIVAQDADTDVGNLLKTGGTNADFGTVISYVRDVISLLINFAGIIALIMIFYATIIYVTSYGDDAKIETAKKTLLWSIIGVIIVALAWIIVYFVNKKLFYS